MEKKVSFDENIKYCTQENNGDIIKDGNMEESINNYEDNDFIVDLINNYTEYYKKTYKNNI